MALIQVHLRLDPQSYKTINPYETRVPNIAKMAAHNIKVLVARVKAGHHIS